MRELFIFQSALAEFLRFRRCIAWIIVAVLLFGLSKIYGSSNLEDTPAETYALLSGMLVFHILPLASAIFSTAVVSQEVEQKTIVYLLTRPVSRIHLLWARALASMIAVFVISALTAVSVSLAVPGSGGVANPALLKDLVALFIGSVAYGSLFVYISLILNRAMMWCLLFAFFWEIFVPGMPGDLYYLSISTHLSAIAQRVAAPMSSDFLTGVAGQPGENSVAVSAAWMAMIGLSVVCLAVGAWWFNHFEYVPREDAE